jgi:hypothetical protein
MKPRVHLLIVAIVALMLGLIIAQPLFNSNINRVQYPNENVAIDVDVVYAYFSTQPVSENITGLIQSKNSHYTPGSFFVVLNVTNNSNVSLIMSMFYVVAAQEILIENNLSSGGGYSRRAHLPFFQYQQKCFDVNSLYSVNDVMWQPYESRLVALSGFTQFDDCSLLQDGTFYIGSHVMGGVLYGYPDYYVGGGAKLINVKSFGDEYFYNILVAENEALCVSPSGLTVEIISGS